MIVGSNRNQVFGDFTKAFLNFIYTIKTRRFYNDLLEDNKQLETDLY